MNRFFAALLVPRNGTVDATQQDAEMAGLRAAFSREASGLRKARIDLHTALVEEMLGTKGKPPKHETH